MFDSNYLVALDGYDNRYFDTWEEVNAFLGEVAKEKEASCDTLIEKWSVAKWLWDMETNYFSVLYTDYPDIIIIL